MAAFVVGEGKFGNEVSGIVGGYLHGYGTGCMFGCIGVEKDGVEFQTEDHREQFAGQSQRVRLKDIVYRVGPGIEIMQCKREIVFTDYRLGSCCSKMAVQQDYMARFAGYETVCQCRCEVSGIVEEYKSAIILECLGYDYPINRMSCEFPDNTPYFEKYKKKELKK